MKETWFVYCVGCGDLMFDRGQTMPCCGLGFVCSTCHDKHKHYEIVTTTTATASNWMPELSR